MCETHLEQLKYTDGMAFRVTIGQWKALREDALRLGLEPRMVFDFESFNTRLIVTEEKKDG